jgi:hypothetical protein
MENLIALGVFGFLITVFGLIMLWVKLGFIKEDTYEIRWKKFSELRTDLLERISHEMKMQLSELHRDMRNEEREKERMELEAKKLEEANARAERWREAALKQPSATPLSGPATQFWVDNLNHRMERIEKFIAKLAKQEWDALSKQIDEGLVRNDAMLKKLSETMDKAKPEDQKPPEEQAN